MSGPNYYSVLGVASGSEDVVIRAAFKALMLKYHPDQNSSNPKDAEARAKELNEAYAVLRDPSKRAAYDAKLKDQRQRSAHSGSAGSKGGGQPGSAEPRTGASSRPTPTPPPRTPPAHNGDGPWTGMSGAHWAGVAAVVFLIGLGLANAPTTSGEVSLEAYDSPAMSADNDGVVDLAPAPIAETKDTTVRDNRIREGVDEFDRIFEKSGILGAANYSRSCFNATAASKDWQQMDFCVAFDYVAQGVDQAVASRLGTERLTYFDDRRVASRHEEALQLLSGDALSLDRIRLDDIKDRTQEQMRYFWADKQKAENRAAALLAQRNRIPQAFQGEWNEALSACGTGLNDTALRIGPDQLQFYESAGQVVKIIKASGRSISLEAAFAGEGETWKDTVNLDLSADGDRLTVSSDGHSTVRRRCPGTQEI